MLRGSAGDYAESLTCGLRGRPIRAVERTNREGAVPSLTSSALSVRESTRLLQRGENVWHGSPSTTGNVVRSAAWRSTMTCTARSSVPASTGEHTRAAAAML